MTRREFMRVARDEHLLCGQHYVVYDDGVIERYTLLCTVFYTGTRREYKPPAYGDSEEYRERYLEMLKCAHKKTTTLFAKRGVPWSIRAFCPEDLSTELAKPGGSDSTLY